MFGVIAIFLISVLLGFTYYLIVIFGRCKFELLLDLFLLTSSINMALCFSFKENDTSSINDYFKFGTSFVIV